eukprot:SAG22_NODE_465_length_10181_cov_6.604444_20_plen_72_part_00
MSWKPLSVCLSVVLPLSFSSKPVSFLAVCLSLGGCVSFWAGAGLGRRSAACHRHDVLVLQVSQLWAILSLP